MEKSKEADENNTLGTIVEKKIISVLEQIDSGFKKVMFMYTIAFYLGIILVASSVLIFVFKQGDKSSLFFGGIGILDLVAFLVFKPAEDLQISRGNLAQLLAAFLCWINDNKVWSQFISNKVKKEGIKLKDLKDISKIMISNTVTIINSIEFALSKKKPKTEQASKQIESALNETKEKNVPTKQE